MALLRKGDVINAINDEVLSVTRDKPWSAATKELTRLALYELKQNVEELPEVAERGWISVKDRLPEPEREVLLIAHGWKSRILYIGCLHHMDAQKSWLTGITSKESDWLIQGWSYLKEPTVTHWMPLPELPKEADHENA